MVPYFVDGPELDLVRFEEIKGVPIRYARAPVSCYGSLGVARSVRLDREFLTTLEACLEELWSYAPQGRAEAIVSAGCYVEKPGMHGAGRAIDIDSIWWETGPPVVTLNYPKDPRRYLAVEAVIRKHFGLVLDYHYNSAHRDHFHIDDSQQVGFFSTRSRVVFVQAALIELWSCTIDLDGRWGKQSIGAAEAVTSLLADKRDITTFEGWMTFLDAVATRGFAQSVAPPLPA